MTRSRIIRSLTLIALSALVTALPAGSAMAAPGDSGLTVTASGPQTVGNTVTVTVEDDYSCNYTDVTFTYTMRVIGPNTQTQTVSGKESVTFTYQGALPGVDTIIVTANGHFSFGPCQAAFPRHGSTTQVWLPAV